VQPEAEAEIRRAFHQENFSTHLSMKKRRMRDVSKNPTLSRARI
jgi:hypothetical protein